MIESTLSSAQRAWLRKKAHGLHPMVMIGQNGYSPAVLAAMEEALTAHELIKVKFLESKDQRQQICQEAAKNLHADLVGLIGNIGIFYRAGTDPENRLYHLPVKKVPRV